MRFVDVKLKCGWSSCGTVGSEGEGTVITRVIDVDGRPREVEICKKHQDDLDEMLRPLLEDGRPVKKSSVKKSSGGSTKVKHETVDLNCQFPDCGRELKNTAGMAQHVTRTHGYDSLEHYHQDYPPSG